MTEAEYGELYLSGHVLENYDSTYEFFSHEISEKFQEEYDLGEIIIETHGRCVNNKEFDKALRFGELLRTKQPQLYDEYFEFIDRFLVDYYCFKKEPQKVEEAFSRFAEDPLKDYDMFSPVLEKLMYYQYKELANKVAKAKYEEVKNCDKLIGGAEVELARIIHFANIEEYAQNIKTGKDKEEAKKILLQSSEGYEISIPDDLWELMNKVFLNQDLTDEISETKFYEQQKLCLRCLFVMLTEKMKSYGVSFWITNRIWANLLGYWNQNEKSAKKRVNPKDYFKIDAKKYEDYLNNELERNFITGNDALFITVLWGRVYVYDFLLSLGLISQATYDNFKQIANELKGEKIIDLKTRLWENNFIHDWTKPDSISEQEFEAEKRIFEKTATLKLEERDTFLTLIADELENMGDFAPFILQGAKKVEKKEAEDEKRMKKLFGNSNFKGAFENVKQGIANTLGGGKETSSEVSQVSQKTRSTVAETIRKEEKIGRNDPCTCGSGKKYKKCCGK
jgi:uncharacterized protein YecA (UPF0149 family)